MPTEKLDMYVSLNIWLFCYNFLNFIKKCYYLVYNLLRLAFFLHVTHTDAASTVILFWFLDWMIGPQGSFYYYTSKIKLYILLGLPGGSEVKNPPANSVDSWTQTLGQEYPLKREMATHYSILAWEIPWTEEPGGLRMVHGVAKESDSA